MPEHSGRDQGILNMAIVVGQACIVFCFVFRCYYFCCLVVASAAAVAVSCSPLLSLVVRRLLTCTSC